MGDAMDGGVLHRREVAAAIWKGGGAVVVSGGYITV